MPAVTPPAGHPRSRHSSVVDTALTFGGFVALWLTLDRLAAWLGSLRGEHGVVVFLVVVALAFAVETASSRRRPLDALAALGLRAPRRDVLLAALTYCVGALAFYPVYAVARELTIAVRPAAFILAIGIFAQGGIAEELVFRGFLFRRLRETRTFWRAAAIAAIPFIAVHALLFLTLDPITAAAALSVSLSMSFPLAWLFERSGNSVWPCALVHAVTQGAIKLIEVDPAAFQPLALAWMAIAALGPWSFFLLRPRADRTRR
jgi:membrane protease YdiL (CAAX protease family)